MLVSTIETRKSELLSTPYMSGSHSMDRRYSLSRCSLPERWLF